MTNKRRNRWMSGLDERPETLSLQGFLDGELLGCLLLLFDFPFLCSISPLLSAFALGNGVAALFHFFAGDPLWIWALCSSLAALSLIYLSFFVMALIAFFAQKKDVKGHWFFRILTVFLVPFHYLGYFPIMVKVFFGKADRGWEEIARVKETR
jgi:hypothetical protein